MNLNHLKDNELIDYVIKYDTDPVRLRLATYMDRHPGAILDDLERAGMDEVHCTFRDEDTCNDYLPGQYINHLRNEIHYLTEQLNQALNEIEELKPMSVTDLIAQLRQEILAEKYARQSAEQSRYKAQQDRDEMKDKLNMWTILNR